MTTETTETVVADTASLTFTADFLIAEQGLTRFLVGVQS